MKDDKMLVKHKDKFYSKLGKAPLSRTIDELLDKGVIVIDKDSGPTSHQTTDYLKQILNIEKAGHSGTLDPKVTGVLVCGLGRATKLMEYMLLSNKEYVCLMYIHKEITQEQLDDAIKNFTGTIKQIPPVISAVKRQERQRTIYYIELLDFDGQNALMRVGCERGTYMRKLCSDMGEYLETGGHMKELRRTKAGPFRETDGIISLDKLRNLLDLYKNSENEEKNKFELELRKHILPMEEIVKEFKKVIVRDSAVSYIAHGADLAIPGVAKLDDGISMGDTVAMMTAQGELIGMGMAFLNSKDVMRKDKGAFVKTNKVFMDPDYYPKRWDFDSGEE